jgi:mutator protein MutT
MNRIDVAIGIVSRGDRVLVCRRKAEGSFGGYWEFPGGKCTPGESPAQCVVRELSEELAIEVRPTRALEIFEHDYPHLHVRLHPFFCELARGEPKPIECVQLEWVEPQRLVEYRFPEGNGPLILSVIALLGDARVSAGASSFQLHGPRL